VRCRTAALGGHRDRCSDCGHTAISYNSCRNRHCPRCQGNARLRSLQQRERELLPTRYIHAVFTLPRELAPLALQNKRILYSLLFRASAEALQQVARDPRHLGAFHDGHLQFHGHLAPLAEPRSFAAWLRILFRHDWVVYSKRPFGGPEHVLRYLGAYTHRVGISNSRLLALSDGHISFRWRLRAWQQEAHHEPAS